MKNQIEQNSKFIQNLKKLGEVKPLSLTPENMDYYCEFYPDFDNIFRQKTLHPGLKGT